jgi:hypothetical protein
MRCYIHQQQGASLVAEAQGMQRLQKHRYTEDASAHGIDQPTSIVCAAELLLCYGHQASPRG